MKPIALAAVLLVTLVGPAWAGFDEGMAAYDRGDYATALKEFRRSPNRAIWSPGVIKWVGYPP